jgi:DNA-binding GntR family transcriptional regulator
MQSIPRRTLTEAATDALRERILHGAYAAGEPLRQEALAAELGVSRIPLREALQRLEAEGLVALLPHRGAVVAELPVADLEELFAIRSLIEGDLLARAIPLATVEDLSAARRAAEVFERAIAREETGRLGQANSRFHAALYAPARRPRTMEIIDRLHTQCDRLLRLQLTLTHGGDRAVREHRALLRAAERGDVARAVRLLHEHVEGAGARLADALATQPLQESR